MTEELRRSESIIPSWRSLNHTTYIGLKPTYINLHPDPLKYDRVQRHPRVQYASNPALTHEGTHYSHHLSTLSARSVIHMIELPEVLGLPEHAVSYKVSKHRQAYNGTVLN
jgi:hypothetical protein